MYFFLNAPCAPVLRELSAPTKPLLSLLNCFPAFTRGRRFFFLFLASCGRMSGLRAFLLSWHPQVSDFGGVGTAPCTRKEALGAASHAPPHLCSLPRLFPLNAQPHSLIGRRLSAPPRPTGIKTLVATSPARAVPRPLSPRSGPCNSIAFPSSLSGPPPSSPGRAALRPQPCAAPWPLSPTPAWRGKRIFYQSSLKSTNPQPWERGETGTAGQDCSAIKTPKY